MQEVSKIRSTARTPDYSGTTSSDWSAPDLEDYGYDSVEDMTQEEKSDVASHSLLGDANADTFAELQFFPVVEPSSGNLNENALRAVISGRGSQADISASAKQSAQNKARNLLEDEFDMDTEKFKGEISEKELATLVGNKYDMSTGEALEMLDTLPEVQKHMEKEELIETVKKVRNDEMEMKDALDKFIDVDKEVIEEIKEELDKEDEGTEEGEDETKKEKEEENETWEDRVEKIMEEENISKSQATVRALDEDPELYTKYKSRGG